MSDEQLKHESIRMIGDGFLLGVVNDVQPKGKFNLLSNARTFIEGIIESRPRLGDFLILPALSGIPHSIKTIINEYNSTFNRIVGAGTKLYTGASTPLVQKDTGYSGDPLFIVDFRPENAVEAYAYIADTNKFKKLSVSDTLSDVGITAPSLAATWRISKPVRKVIDKIDTGSDTDWNHLTGSAGAPSLQTRINTTITKYLADGALPDFASIVPAAMTANLQKDSIVLLNGTTDVIIEEVLPAALNTGVAIIAKITYTTGSTGACTIVLDISSTNIVRNSILLLNGTEYVRVLDVTLDGNNIPSIQTSTVGTFAAGNTVSGAASFRFYDTIGGYVSPNTIASQSLKSSISASGLSSITRTFNIDLLNADGRALSLDDMFHISTLLSNSSFITEFQIQLSVEATPLFTNNYFYYAVSPSALNSSVLQTAPTIAAIQQQIQQDQLLNDHILRNQEIDPFGRDGLLVENPTGGITYSTEIQDASLGASQWTELEIKLSDFQRVGEDQSKTLKDVTAIRISVNASVAVDLYIDAIWVGGADALNSNDQGFLPYNYVYQIYDPSTRVISNWSPPLRTGIKIKRGRVELTFPSANSLYSTNYKIRIARFGGTLNDFRILGTIKNDGGTYIDISSDRLIADNDLAGRYEGQGANGAVFDYYKPFAILDQPKKGVCNIVGTKLTWVSGDKFNITYPRGTEIVINGQVNSFYTFPTDDSHVELESDMGALTSVVFELSAPLLTGQPLPIILGTFGDGNFGLYIAAIGDKNSAGTFYWLDGNSPDTMSDLNRLEITSPSEPLVGGIIYDGFFQVYSTQRSFTIYPSQDSLGRFSFIARENANSRGLYCKTAIDTSPAYIYFLSENADGLYRVQGNGNPECITIAGFQNLFYNNDKAPTSIILIDGTIIYPPDFTATADLRLFCTNDLLYFRFKDTNGSYVALVLDCKTGNFISYDTYPSNIIGAIYREEIKSSVSILAGTTDAIKKFGSSGTFESSINSKVIPFAFDTGDSRIIKEFKELIVKVDNGTGGLLVQTFYNNADSFDSAIAIAGAVSHKRQQFIINLQDSKGVGKLFQNITSVFRWTLDAGVKLYEEIFYWSAEGDIITDRTSDVEFAGNIGEKLWQGVVIEANTFGIAKTLKYYDDENILQATIIINHNGKSTIAYSFDQPFISHSIRRTSIDGISWLPIVEQYITDSEPESANVWEGEFNTGKSRGQFGVVAIPGLITIKRMGIAYRSTDDAIFTLIFDDETTQDYNLPNSNSTWHKEFFYAFCKKWTACKIRIKVSNNGNIRVYNKHSEIWMHQYNSEQPFTAPQEALVGGQSNVTGIEI